MSLVINLLGEGEYEFDSLVLDLNGTLALDGKLIEGVTERLKSLSSYLRIYLITADTNKTAQDIFKELDIKLHILKSGRGDIQKLKFIESLSKDKVIAIGNGVNDYLMLKEAGLGICIIGPEGVSTQTLLASDVVFKDICEALDFLIKPSRITATLRR